MKKSELIKVLQDIEEDFDVKSFNHDGQNFDVAEVTINHLSENITLWPETN